MRLISLIFIVVLLFSCKKKTEESVVVSENLSNGMVVLCEGLFQQNNSTVSFVNKTDGSISNTLFQDKVGRMLGDTGNDIQKYGGKIYIVVNVSSTIEVVNASTFKSIAQISMIENGTAKQPRSIVFNNGFAYVTCYDGYVDVIDTVSLTVQQRIQVGRNPEGMAVANNKLYVANSGGLSAPDYDSTLSVIDLNSNIELLKINVGKNPSGVIADNSGEIYVINRGDYGAVPSSISRVNSSTDVEIEELAINATHLVRMNSDFLIANYDYSSQLSGVIIFNPQTETVTNSSFITNTGITTLYGLQYNSTNGNVYISDAMGFTNSGYIREYTNTGTLVQSFHVGLNPNKIIFYD